MARRGNGWQGPVQQWDSGQGRQRPGGQDHPQHHPYPAVMPRQDAHDPRIGAERGDRPRRHDIFDDDFLVLVNGWWEKLQFRLPDVDGPRAWRVALDTYGPAQATSPEDLHAGDDITIGPQSIVVLQRPARPPE